MTSAFLFSKVLAAVMRKKTTSELEKSSPAELQQDVTPSANFGFLNQLNFYEETHEHKSATSAEKAIQDNSDANNSPVPHLEDRMSKSSIFNKMPVEFY